MASTDEQLTEIPDEPGLRPPEPQGRADQPPKSFVTQVDTSTFLKIAENYLNRHKAKLDINTGQLGLTFPAAAQLMAEALAEILPVRGKVLDIDTKLPGEISNAAVSGTTDQNGKKSLPCNIAFGSTLGKLRTERIRAGIRESIHKMATHRDAEGKRRLHAELTRFNATQNYTKVGAGNAYTIDGAIKHVLDRVAVASDRGGPATLATDILSRIGSSRAAELGIAGPRFITVSAAAIPAEKGLYTNSQHDAANSPLDELVRWDDSVEYEEAPNMQRVRDLAEQCAMMDYLTIEQLNQLSEDVARRIHHPFGLTETAGHAAMLTAFYLYTGEAPYAAMQQAWVYTSESDAAQQFWSGRFGQLIDTVQAALVKAIKKSPLRWMGRVDVRPSATDTLRLLAATVATARTESPQAPVWPQGLLEEVLRRYGVSDEDVPGAAKLLEGSFSLQHSPTGEIQWWKPSQKWNTVGCRILERVATFDYNMTGGDLEDLRARASHILPLNRLSELRDNLVRAETDFPQTVREGESRSQFTHGSLEETNAWLWKFGRLQATTFFKEFKNERENAHRGVRGLEAERMGTGVRAIPPRQRAGTVQTPNNWFVLATSRHATRMLSKSSGSSASAHPGMTAAETRSAAVSLLNILGRAENYPATRPDPGQEIPEWVSERVEEFNSLEEDIEQLIDPYETNVMAILLEVAVRLTIEKEAGE